MERVFKLADIRDLVRECWEKGHRFPVWALHGEMGAGKTTFVHALCDMLGVTDAVGSPTFSLINEYAYDCAGTRRRLFHIDLYRLRDAAEARAAGVEDCLYSGHPCLVEWPEKAPELFPEDTLHCWLETVDAQTRRIRIPGI